NLADVDDVLAVLLRVGGASIHEVAVHLEPSVAEGVPVRPHSAADDLRMRSAAADVRAGGAAHLHRIGPVRIEEIRAGAAGFVLEPVARTAVERGPAEREETVDDRQED